MTHPILQPASTTQPPAADEQTAAPTSSVRVTHLTQVFERDRPPVLDRIDLDVGPGEFVCLLGASGCGKSTLLSLIAGLGAPTSGSIEITVGRPALMFQEPALLPWLTAAGNVELALKARRVGRRERRTEAERLLTLVNLAGQGHKRVHELSGGMRQRVALARALAQDSRLLLMDEPFAALDALTREQLYGDLQSIWQKRKKTIIFVTHNVREAACLGDRVVLFSPHPGRIREQFKIDLPRPRDINSVELARYSTTITAALKNRALGQTEETE